MRGVMVSRSFCIRSLILLCLALLWTVGIWAQSTTDGAIGGTVTDPSGALVAGAGIPVTNISTGIEQTTTSDETGYIRVAKLQPSSYRVKIEAKGFALFTAETVIVQVGSVTDLPAKLNFASHGETVVVSAESPAINTTSQ